MLVQRFEPQGRRFINVHYYYYYYVGLNVLTCQTDIRDKELGRRGGGGGENG